MISLGIAQSQQAVATPQSFQKTEAIASQQTPPSPPAIEKMDTQATQVQPINAGVGSTKVSYYYDKSYHGVVINITDKDHKLIRQIPSKEAIKQYQLIQAILEKGQK